MPRKLSTRGAEEGQQDEAGVPIEMELAVAGVIALGGIGMETVQQRPQDLEVLEAAQVLIAEFLAARVGHSAESGAKAGRAACRGAGQL